MKTYFKLFSVIAFATILSACSSTESIETPDPSLAELNYIPCTDKPAEAQGSTRTIPDTDHRQPEIKFSLKDRILSFKLLNQTVNCQLNDVHVSITKDSDDVFILVSLTEGTANCICHADIDATIKDFQPGTYNVKVMLCHEYKYSADKPEGYSFGPYEIFSQTLTLTNGINLEFNPTYPY